MYVPRTRPQTNTENPGLKAGKRRCIGREL
jgi:hypothetical protein